MKGECICTFFVRALPLKMALRFLPEIMVRERSRSGLALGVRQPRRTD